ncbi:MAG: hypothetical protein JO263_09320 [Candidatus Eremiobacteraeota bacterium]|nr:hypothetical protein [Candidatus Eremiobacteraeota bacterium]
MRRFPIEVLIGVICVVMLALGWRIYGAGEMARFGPAIHAQKAPSRLYASMTVKYSKPPLYEEDYRMSDIEGISRFEYSVRGFNGHQITVTAPAARVYDVSFFFGRLTQDGIWQLVNKPALPNAEAVYSVYVRQFADYQHGERTVTFSDPRYWASRAGREFSIDLRKGIPKNLVYIQNSQLSDARYEQIVKDFRDFGPPEFRHNIAAAVDRIKATHG